MEKLHPDLPITPIRLSSLLLLALLLLTLLLLLATIWIGRALEEEHVEEVLSRHLIPTPGTKMERSRPHPMLAARELWTGLVRTESVKCLAGGLLEIVGLARFGVHEATVRGRDGFESLLSPPGLTSIRMKSQRQSSITSLDLDFGGGFGNKEGFIVGFGSNDNTCSMFIILWEPIPTRSC